MPVRLDATAAIRLARERGRLMHQAGQTNPGGMAAVLGLDSDKVAAICRQTGSHVANYNCPGQVVISGDKLGLEKAIALTESAGASRVVPLRAMCAARISSPCWLDGPTALAAVMARDRSKRDLKEPRPKGLAPAQGMLPRDGPLKDRRRQILGQVLVVYPQPDIVEDAGQVLVVQVDIVVGLAHERSTP